jgi:antitoxin YefM
MNAISYSTARNNLAFHLNRVVEDHDTTIITRQSGPAAVLMSLSEYESWQETLALLRGGNGRRLLTAVEDIASGKNIQARELIHE